MWEAIQTLATNPVTLVVALIIIGIVVYGVRTGKISYKAHGLNVGDNSDRILIRNQLEYAETACKGQYRLIRDFCDNEYHARFIIAEVIDVFQAACIHNFISDDEIYIRSKKNLVLLTIQKYATNDHFFTPEFRTCCDKFVEGLIKDLYHMKSVMKN